MQQLVIIYLGMSVLTIPNYVSILASKKLAIITHFITVTWFAYYKTVVYES